MEKCNCSFPENMEMKINNIPVDPCKFIESECYKNVTIQILKCEKCGRISIGWKRQNNTEKINSFED